MEQARVLSETVLPEALNTLASRHESLDKVVAYLEGSYLAAMHKDLDRSPIEVEAREYLANALMSVASDVDKISASLDELLTCQASAVDTLAHQVSMLQTRMHLSKERLNREKLADLQASQDTEIDRASASRVLMQVGEMPLTYPPFERVPLQQRLNALSSVGVNLAQPKDATATTATGAATGAGASVAGAAGGDGAKRGGLN